MFLLHKKPTLCILPSYHPLFCTLLRLSTLTTQNPPHKSCFMVQYLISSCGFPLDGAIEASKRLTHIKSPSKPDSVLHFLRQCGLDDTQIRTLVSKEPTVLCTNVEKTLKPKFRVLQGMGFSQSELTQLVAGQPYALRCTDVQRKIELWRSLFVTPEKLIKAISNDIYLLSSSFAKRIMPNISLFRECRIPDEQIGKLILSLNGTISRSPDMLREAVRKAEELGASRGSGMFWHAIRTMLCLSKATLDAKIKLLKSLGWSDEDIRAAIRTQPTLLRLSEKNICDKVGFFTKEAGCEPSFVAQRPELLTYSLKTRLVPRHSILRILKNEGLFAGQKGLVSAINTTEERFVERFVIPYEEKIPRLREAYVAASAGEKLL